MIEDAFVAAGEAEGLRVADEVHLVAEGGELNAQFGCNNARAAVSGVTCDADFHSEVSKAFDVLEAH
jgi:hypothetical protein